VPPFVNPVGCRWWYERYELKLFHFGVMKPSVEEVAELMTQRETGIRQTFANSCVLELLDHFDEATNSYDFAHNPK
jgi:hypothetical protein